MSANVRLTMRAALLLGVFVGIHSAAHAFFPMGEFDEYERLHFIRWSWPSFNDRNSDGDISGPNEGIEYMVEGGDYGFTDPEIDVIREAFDVWQDVPTAHVGFQLQGVNQDPLVIGEGVIDLINYIAIDAEDDPFALGVGGGVLGVTFLTWLSEGEGLDAVGLPISFEITPHQMIEADILIDGVSHRAAGPGEEPLADLKGTLVHEIGHFIGLMHTPLNNLAIITVGDLIGLVESPAFAQRDASGLLQHVGATPTMFPIMFLTDDGRGDPFNGGSDLAPDDIAGVSFMYPRGSQDNFFTIIQEARTQTHANLPSIPNIGGNVVAWCDADDDPATSRVPLISTMSGLYEYQPLIAGRFYLHGLLKVIETIGGPAPFQATYTLTINPLNNLAYERQAPFTGYSPEELFDAIANHPFSILPPAWPSEVFHELGNIFDIENYDIGTPLTYERSRSSVISVDSGKTLATMLPGRNPMFGDRNDVCPLNMMLEGTETTVAAAGLRGFRDTTLLNSAAGTALVELYYQMSPALARFLLRHPWVLSGARTAMSLAEWVASHYGVALTALLAFILGLGLYRRRRRAVVVAAVLLTVCLVAPQAGALIAYLTDEEMVAMSDDIVTGEVTSVSSQVVQQGYLKRIMTDVTVAVTDTVKGGQNKSSTLYLRVPGGRVGPVVTRATAMPQFKVGDEVLLYLEYKQGFGHVVVAGERGKFDITTDTETGAKHVVAMTVVAKSGLAASAEAVKQGGKGADANSGGRVQRNRIPLEAYTEYLRGIAKAQKKK